MLITGKQLPNFLGKGCCQNCHAIKVWSKCVPKFHEKSWWNSLCLDHLNHLRLLCSTSLYPVFFFYLTFLLYFILIPTPYSTSLHSTPFHQHNSILLHQLHSTNTIQLDMAPPTQLYFSPLYQHNSTRLHQHNPT